MHTNRWDAGVARRSTYWSPWKYISSLYDKFWQLVRFKVGNERRIRFWEDVWCNSQALSNRFVDLYRLSMASNSTIAELCVPKLVLHLMDGIYVFIRICMTKNLTILQT